MPMYEYDCEKCGNTFEELVRGSETVICPECGSKKVVRKLSTFSACSGGHSDSQPASGSCSTGCCPFA